MKTMTTKTEEYDLVVLGCGEAGKYLAWTFAKQGKRVVVIERKLIGGSCPNIACMPSKNVIHSAKVASYFFRSPEFGITKDNCQIHMPGVRERKRQMVQGMIDVHVARFKASGAELLMGSGRFIAPKTIQVELSSGGTRVIRGKSVVIGTGSRAKLDPIPGLREAGPMTHVEALELEEIPRHLLIIGGGYIGVELGQAMRRFGSKVTIIERNGRLLHREDEDVTTMLQDLFKSEGIEIVTNFVIDRVEGTSGKSVKLHAVRNGSQLVHEGTHLLVAAGRTPNTDGLGLELAGVQTTERGYVKAIALR
jgi:pyruvate/2-oxoglutarate dehydrogenase complex dihydrolipoamide dehydrogenase (E3) component